MNMKEKKEKLDKLVREVLVHTLSQHAASQFWVKEFAKK